MTIIQRSYRLLSPAFEQKIEYIAAVLIVHKTFSRQNGYMLMYPTTGVYQKSGHSLLSNYKDSNDVRSFAYSL